ncbi:MAG: hypothetical protein Q8M15_08835 [Bacteroidota bacterium]|nr:hypothetical protein [Bacteroidota bacterium]
MLRGRKSPLNEWKVMDLDPETIFDWVDVYKCRFIKEYKTNNYICPKCESENSDEAVIDIVMIYFISPGWTWEHLCGRAGNLYICKKHKRQIDFDLISMN